MEEPKSIKQMAEVHPAGFSRIDSIIRNGAGSIVNVIGVVSDIMPISVTSGSDLQMTLTIRDHGLNVNGIRVKFFKETKELMPSVTQNGDVLILRALKIAQWRGELMGISSWKTQHLVFPCKSIVGTESRERYAISGACLDFSASKGAQRPSIHEQQWVISLHYQDEWQSRNNANASEAESEPPRSSLPSQSSTTDSLLPDLPTTDQYSTIVRPSKPQVNVAPSKASTLPEVRYRDKFSLLKDVKIDHFCDLAGEVVKLFPDAFGSCVEMYISDYTSNDILPDYHVGAKTDPSGLPTRIPHGKMTLKVELRPPHAQWAMSNIKEGNIVLLKNVRVKRSNGGQVEGNMWLEKFHPDRVNVMKLEPRSSRYEEVVAQRATYSDSTEAQFNGTATDAVFGNSGKKESKGQRKRKRKAAQLQAAAEAEMAAEKAKEVAENNNSNNNENGHAERDESDVDSVHSQPLSKKKLNPRVQCVYEDMQLSTFNEMVNNPRRVSKDTKTSEKVRIPFINTKYCVKLRIVDYYPHSIRQFARQFPDQRNPSISKWEWDFWLVVCAGDVSDVEKRCINVCVGGQAATDLLDDDATDLSANPRTLRRLQSTLWTLWGDLAEQKDKFLAAHPNIPGNEHFTAAKYHISANNIPFKACIAEYGVQVPCTDITSDKKDRTAPIPSKSIKGREHDFASQVAPVIDTEPPMIWERVWKLCDTRVRA